MLLLVDDDIDDIELVQEALQRNNFSGTVDFIHNGEALLKRLKKSFHDLPEAIILDLNMPLKDGFEVLSDIKTDSNLSDIPIFILTASGNEHDKIRCMNLGCSLFFRKPATMEEYDSIITLILNFINAAKTA